MRTTPSMSMATVPKFKGKGLVVKEEETLAVREATLALVKGPKKPEVGVILLALWNLMTAERVAWPKNVVSLPGEPGPEVETVKPLWFRYDWRILTSGLRLPTPKD